MTPRAPIVTERRLGSQTGTWLTADLHAAFDAKARELGLSKAELLRRLVEECVRKGQVVASTEALPLTRGTKG